MLLTLRRALLLDFGLLLVKAWSFNRCRQQARKILVRAGSNLYLSLQGDRQPL